MADQLRNAVEHSDSAQLPTLYVSAVAAIQECARVDECATWAKKAAAMASYAKQSKDDTMEVAAKRIRGRAVRRLGELYRAIPDKPGTRTDLMPAPASGSTLKAQARKEAGISVKEAVTAVRVANVPVDEFEAAMESKRPPTVEELAERGTAKRKPLIDLKGRNPEDYNRALHIRATINALADTLKQITPAAVIRGTLPIDFKKLSNSAEAVNGWLNKLTALLEKEKP